jgi:integrase
LPSLEAAAARFLSERRGTISDASLAHYERLLRLWVLPQLGSKPLAEIDACDAVAIRDACPTPQLGNGAVTVARMVANAAREWGWVKRNPFRIRRRQVHARKRAATFPEIVDFLREATWFASQAGGLKRPQFDVWRLVALTGCRFGEAQALEWVEWHGDSLLLDRHKTSARVGSKRIALGPGEDLLHEVRALGLSRVWVFPARRRTGPGHVGLARTAFDRICEAARIHGLRPHDLRGGWASHAAEMDVPIDVIQAQLGHANVATTLRYVQGSSERQRKAVDLVGASLTGGRKK